MKLSEEIKKRDDMCLDSQGDLNNWAERACAMEELVKAVAHIGVDFGYGEFKLDDKHINKAREIFKEWK
jgi:hypothetical protein